MRRRVERDPTHGHFHLSKSRRIATFHANVSETLDVSRRLHSPRSCSERGRLAALIFVSAPYRDQGTDGSMTEAHLVIATEGNNCIVEGSFEARRVQSSSPLFVEKLRLRCLFARARCRVRLGALVVFFRKNGYFRIKLRSS